MKAPKGQARELQAEGRYPAVARVIADIGTQVPKDSKFSPRRMLIILWELVEISTKDNVAYIAQRIPFSSKSKNYKKMLKTWMGMAPDEVADFDASDMLNKGAEIEIVHSDDGEYANVDRVSPAPKGKMAKGFMKPVSVFLERGAFDKADFEELPEWIQNLAIESEEFKEVSGERKKVAAAVKKKK